MSEVIERFNEEEFIKDLIKKLENILKKAPIQTKAKVFKDKVEISIMGFPQPLIVFLDFSKSVKENIFMIKSSLYDNYYPTIDFVTEFKENFSIQEIESLIEGGMSLSEALTKQKTTETKETYKISRVLVPKDEIFLKNIKDSSDEKLFKLKMPLSIFLKRMREKWTKEETNRMFKKYAEFQRIIYPASVWKELNEDITRVTKEEAND